MPQVVSCHACQKALKLPDNSAGKAVTCSGCDTRQQILATPEGVLALVPMGFASGPDEPEAEHEQEPESKSDTKGTARPKRKRLNHQERSRQAKMSSAATWILVLAALYALSGLLQGYQARKDAEELRAELVLRDNDEPLFSEFLELEAEDEEPYTVGEFRKELRQAEILSFGIPMLLAAIMLALFFWAKSSALPAILTALAVFLVAQVASAIIDPSTIAKGLVLKGFALVALLRGVKAALAAQAPAETDA